LERVKRSEWKKHYTDFFRKSMSCWDSKIYGWQVVGRFVAQFVGRKRMEKIGEEANAARLAPRGVDQGLLKIPRPPLLLFAFLKGGLRQQADGKPSGGGRQSRPEAAV
jgi:hypothetical protein